MCNYSEWWKYRVKKIDMLINSNCLVDSQWPICGFSRVDRIYEVYQAYWKFSSV